MAIETTEDNVGENGCHEGGKIQTFPFTTQTLL